jgi:hypothetical protein
MMRVRKRLKTTYMERRPNDSGNRIIDAGDTMQVEK